MFCCVRARRNTKDVVSQRENLYQVGFGFISRDGRPSVNRKRAVSSEELNSECQSAVTAMKEPTELQTLSSRNPSGHVVLLPHCLTDSRDCRPKPATCLTFQMVLN